MSLSRKLLVVGVTAVHSTPRVGIQYKGLSAAIPRVRVIEKIQHKPLVSTLH